MRKMAFAIFATCVCAASAAHAQGLMADAPSYAERIVAFVKANETWAVPVVSLLAFGESLAFLSLLLPATVILFGITGLLGASGVDHQMAFSIWLAGSLAAAFGYFVSYYVGAWFKDDLGRLWPFSSNPGMLERGRTFFKKWGVWAVFFGHFFGPVRAVIPVVAGSFGVSQLSFMVANVASSMLWAFGILVLPLYGVDVLLH